MAALMASNALAIDAMLPALPAIGEALGVGGGERPAARHHLLPARLRRRADLLRAARRPVRAQAAADRRDARSTRLFAALAGLAASFTLLLAARFAAGHGGGGDPGAGRGGGARPVRGRGDGADHVAGDHRLHGRAGAGAEPRPAHPRLRQLARIFHRPRRSMGCCSRSGAGFGCPRRCTRNIGGRCRPARSAARSARR